MRRGAQAGAGQAGAAGVGSTGEKVSDLLTALSPYLNKGSNDERRADERHDSLMGLAKTVRENLPDGVGALLR